MPPAIAVPRWHPPWKANCAPTRSRHQCQPPSSGLPRLQCAAPACDRIPGPRSPPESHPARTPPLRKPPLSRGQPPFSADDRRDQCAAHCAGSDPRKPGGFLAHSVFLRHTSRAGRSRLMFPSGKGHAVSTAASGRVARNAVRRTGSANERTPITGWVLRPAAARPPGRGLPPPVRRRCRPGPASARARAWARVPPRGSPAPAPAAPARPSAPAHGP